MSANPFIYFSGDSHMAGDELADDTLQCWKDIFGTYQAERDARYRTEFQEAKMKETEHWTIQQQASFRQCMQDRHWTTIVCDKHGIKHHNDAINGSSQEAVLHRAVISFDKFERAGNVPTLAIIQLAPPHRITIYNSSRYVRGWQWYRTQMNEQFGLDKSLNLSTIFNVSPHMNGIHGQYLLAHMDVESETGNIIRWLTTLAITNSYFKEKTGRYPIYVGTHGDARTHFLDPTSNNETISSSPEYKSLIHQARLYTVTHNIWNIKQGYTDNLMCPGGHHTPQTHANFAQFIAPHLLQELNNVS